MLFLLVFSFTALSAQGDKILNLEDYKDWSRIRNTSLSPDGAWMTYTYAPNEGDTSAFYIRQIKGTKLHQSMNAKRVSFSKDSKWVAYLVDPTKSQMEKLRKQKKSISSDLHLFNTSTLKVDTIKEVRSYAFSDASNYIAIKKSSSGKGKHKGSDMIVRDLKNGLTSNIGNVSEYAFNKSGDLLAFLIDAEGKSGNGIYVKDLSSHRIFPLHTGHYTYHQLTWNDKNDGQLAVLFGEKPEDKTEYDNTLLWTSGLKAGMGAIGTASTFGPSNSPSFPKGQVISEYRKPYWNEKGTQLYFGLNEQEDVLSKEDQIEANVDVWHYKDPVEQSRQIVSAGRDRRATYLSVINLPSKQFVQLQDENVSSIQTAEKSKWAVAEVDSAYIDDPDMPIGHADMYSINTLTGNSRLIAPKIYYSARISPLGDYMLYKSDGVVMLYNFETQKSSNLSSRVKDVSLERTTYDRPHEKPFNGAAGWSTDGKWLILPGFYDMYAFALDSDEVVNLTQGHGKKSKIQFRLIQLDPEKQTIDTDQPILLSAYGEWTKKSGFYEASFGKKPKMLRYEEKMMGRPTKAKNADVVIYTEQSFEEFPDYWASTTSFKNPKKITDANPQIKEYAWGKRVLIDYTDRRGNKLQGTLTLPANYQKGKKYPMIIYFYERMSQLHNRFSMPTYDDRPHMSTYASNGYLVFQPDVVYTLGKPGSSAVDDITSAAQAVIDLGYADPDRIGLQGHSWSGYQTSYILTQSDMFACVVTGAPVTNLISFYNIEYKRIGSLNNQIIQWSQGRMGVSPWDDMDLYISQSPVHNADKITTPFLIMHGTEDGAVDWVQGLEFYTAARRMGKEVILLSYPDEPHHLRKEANQKDFQIRMKQYFDYYLKDAKPPKWITKGVKHLNKKKAKPMDE